MKSKLTSTTPYNILEAIFFIQFDLVRLCEDRCQTSESQTKSAALVRSFTQTVEESKKRYRSVRATNTKINTRN